MNARKILATFITLVGLSSLSFAGPLFSYTVTKVTDGTTPEVTRGKVYIFEVQGIDSTGAPANSGQTALLDLTCNGGNCTVIAPSGGNPYQPNIQGKVTFLLRFDTAPNTVQIQAAKNGNATINGSLTVTVQRFPNNFNVALPNGLTVNAGVQFPIIITATNGGTITSFKDTVTVSDDIIGDILTIPGSSFVNGVATSSISLVTGRWADHINHVNITNTVVYVGQGSATTGSSNDIVVTPDAYNRVLLLFPGETPNPGIPPGKTGTVPDQTAGAGFSPISVYAVDQYFNRLDAGLPGGLNISFNSTVGGDTVPGSTALISNPLNVSNQIILNPPLGSRSITAIPSINSLNTSQSVVNAIPGSVAQYRFTVQPASSAPVGTGPDLVADIPFNIEITAYDGGGIVKIDLNGPVNNALIAALPGLGQNINWVDTNPATPVPNNTVNFVNGVAVVPNVLITRERVGATLIFNDGVVPPAVSNIWNVIPGSAKQIHATFKPTQSFLPGEYPGNTGTPPTIIAGSTVEVEMRITDGRWNVVSGADSDNTTVTVLGQGGAIPKYIDAAPLTSDFTLSGVLQGASAPDVTFRSAGSQVLQLQANGAFSFVTNSAAIQVNPGPYSRILLKGPGETIHPGIHPALEPDGKVGIISNQNVGVPFSIEVHATDNFWNDANAAGFPPINFNIDDPNYTLTDIGGTPVTLPHPMGAAREDLRLTLEALSLPGVEVYDQSDIGNSLKHSTISVNMNPGVLHHFRMTLAAPGSKEAGIPFTVTVQAEDVFNNIIPTDNGNVTLLANTGATTMTPETITLTNGIFNGDLTMFTATTTARVQMSRGGVISQGPTFAVTVNVTNGYRRLLLIMNGEQLTPGRNYGTTGKTGSPSDLTVGNAAVVEAYATDIHYNPLLTAGRVRFSSDQYASFAAAEGDLVPVSGISKYATTLTLREAAVHTITLVDVNLPAITPSTSSVTGLAGTYARLQILLPGEVADPGTFAVNGKTNAPATNQEVGTPFNVSVRAVDSFWNIVNFNGGDVVLTSNKSAIYIPPNNTGSNPRPFVNGLSTRAVIIGEEAVIDFAEITARDDANLTKTPQTAQLHVNPGATYQFVFPSTVTAGQAFGGTISLEYGGVPVTGYNESIFLTAVFPSGGNARGSFKSDGSPKEYVMTNGVVNIADLDYSYVEVIQIRLTDNFGRVAFSGNINVVPSGLKYDVVVPSTATAGPPSTFNVSVRLLEQNTDTLVMNRDHQISVNVLSAVNPTANGNFTVSNANFANGQVTFQQSYTKAEAIIIQIAESATNGDPGYVIPSKNSNNINVLADGYKKLLILAPNETHVPGVPSATGKTGTPSARQLGIPFLVQVRGVDQYWNVNNTYFGGQINFSATLPSGAAVSMDVSNPGAPLSNGENASFITLFQTGDISLAVRDTANPAIGGQTVQLNVGGHFYQVDLPAAPPYYAGQNFQMNVTLIDSITGLPVTSANNAITIKAMLPSGVEAAGILQRPTANLNNGTVSINNQNYNTPESIRFRISDGNGVISDSALVEFNSIRVRYEFTVPSEATVFANFPISVQAIDVLTNQPNKVINNRVLSLQAFSGLTGLAVTGTFNPNVITINQGVGNIATANYNQAQPIFLKVIDPTVAPALNPAAAPGEFSSPTINIKAGALASVDVANFSLQSNQTRTVTLVARDAFGNTIGQQALSLSVSEAGGPGTMNMNGQTNIFNGSVNAFGEIQITFDPSDNANGLFKILIADGSNPNGHTQILEINVLGLTLPPAQQLSIGADRIPFDGFFALPLGNIVVPSGGTLQTFYRIDGGPWKVYDPVAGIQMSNVTASMGSGINQARPYTIEWYSQICYTGIDPTCANPVSQLNINGGPNVVTILPYEVDGKMAGYPSPFNPGRHGIMTIQYPLSASSTDEIEIFDLFGQKVYGNVSTVTPSTDPLNLAIPPHGRIFWNGRNDDGHLVANGGYIVRVKVGITGQTLKSKILVAK